MLLNNFTKEKERKKRDRGGRKRETDRQKIIGMASGLGPANRRVEFSVCENACPEVPKSLKLLSRIF